MALEAERGFVLVFNALIGVVEQGTMRDGNVIRQAVFIDLEAVVLATDHHSSALEI
jgi:hypothetical protein